MKESVLDVECDDFMKAEELLPRPSSGDRDFRQHAPSSDSTIRTLPSRRKEKLSEAGIASPGLR